jgi:purine-binding chemotaxis protein CheW
MEMDSISSNNECYLTFRLAKSLFAIHVSIIEGINEVKEITRIPQMPGFICGVVNLRDRALPVIDTKLLFGLGQTENIQNSNIIVLNLSTGTENIVIGSLVDSVEEVIELSDQNILPPPGIGEKYTNQFIKGVFKHNNQFIMIVNIGLFFKNDNIGTDIIGIENKYETA